MEMEKEMETEMEKDVENGKGRQSDSIFNPIGDTPTSGQVTSTCPNKQALPQNATPTLGQQHTHSHNAHQLHTGARAHPQA